jgi:hypothetical protein
MVDFAGLPNACPSYLPRSWRICWNNSGLGIFAVEKKKFKLLDLSDSARSCKISFGQILTDLAISGQSPRSGGIWLGNGEWFRQ